MNVKYRKIVGFQEQIVKAFFFKMSIVLMST